MLAGVDEGVWVVSGSGGEGCRSFVCLRPSPRVRPRVYPRALCCLLVREPDGCVGGCGFSVDCLVATCDGESVVCGASAVDAGVEGDGCGVSLDGGVEGVGAGFAACAPECMFCARVCGFVRGCFVCACVGLFDHGLGCACVFGLFAGVLCARVGDPCVGDGSECLVGVQGDGGGVSACWSSVVALVVVQGCVDGDNAVVCVACALALVRACECACALARECVSCECELAAACCHDGFADQHVGEFLLFVLHPFVDLVLRECYADGGERFVPVTRGGEGAGGDVGVSCADGGGHGFALVEEDEGEARDGACVVHVGVEVGALDDAPVGLRARLVLVCVLVAVVCARSVCEGARGVAAECDGEVGAVAECDDVSVVVFHVVAVEELVEVGGELACVAGRVGGGLAGCEAVLNFLALVHGWLVFLSVVFCLFFFVYAGCALSTVRVWVVLLSARVFLFVMVSWQCCCWQSMVVGGCCGWFRAW